LLRDPSRQVRSIGAQASLDLDLRPDALTHEQLMAHVWIGRQKLDWAPVIRLGQQARPVLETAARGDDGKRNIRPVSRKRIHQEALVLRRGVFLGQPARNLIHSFDPR
jgi:hypothetical protein